MFVVRRANSFRVAHWVRRFRVARADDDDDENDANTDIRLLHEASVAAPRAFDAPLDAALDASNRVWLLQSLAHAASCVALYSTSTALDDVESAGDWRVARGDFELDDGVDHVDAAIDAILMRVTSVATIGDIDRQCAALLLASRGARACANAIRRVAVGLETLSSSSMTSSNELVATLCRLVDARVHGAVERDNAPLDARRRAW